MRIRDAYAGLSCPSLPLGFKQGQRDCQNQKSACAKQMFHKIATHRRINYFRRVIVIQTPLLLSQNAVWYEVGLDRTTNKLIPRALLIFASLFCSTL